MKSLFFLLMTLSFSIATWAAPQRELEVKLDSHTILRSQDVAEATAGENGPSEWAVMLMLKKESAKKFAKVTRENVGKKLDIVWDGKVRSSPTIKGEIKSGAILLSDGFSKEEAVAVAREISAKRE